MLRRDSSSGARTAMMPSVVCSPEGRKQRTADRGHRPIWCRERMCRQADGCFSCAPAALTTDGVLQFGVDLVAIKSSIGLLFYVAGRLSPDRALPDGPLRSPPRADSASPAPRLARFVSLMVIAGSSPHRMSRLLEGNYPRRCRGERTCQSQRLLSQSARPWARAVGELPCWPTGETSVENLIA